MKVKIPLKQVDMLKVIKAASQQQLTVTWTFFVVLRPELHFPIIIKLCIAPKQIVDTRFHQGQQDNNSRGREQSRAELAIWHLDTVTAPLLPLSDASVTTLCGPFCHPENIH